MENNQRITDLLLPVMKEMKCFKGLTDLEYIGEQGVVIATISGKVKHVDVSGYSDIFFAERIMDVLVGLED